MIGEFLEFLGISFGFPFFDFQPLKAWHSLHLGTERYMTKPGGATFSCMRPEVDSPGNYPPGGSMVNPALQNIASFYQTLPPKLEMNIT